jgi:hypothetical protein
MTERLDEFYEHPDRRVYEALTNRAQSDTVRAQAASLSALMRVWYENGLIHCEGEIVPSKSEPADDD